MSGYDIGLSGLTAAQAAFDIIGNNIANSSTEGYHRQDIELSASYFSYNGGTLSGGGVTVEGISRAINTLLEQEIIQQQSALSAVSQETAFLGIIETAFGEFSSEGSGLNVAIDDFFNALQDLSSYPEDSIYQNQLVNTAETMAGQFRTLGEFLRTLENQVSLEVDNAIDSINVLVEQIAELNGQIQKIEIVGNEANTLRDQRDQCISELSELISIQTISRDNGIVDVRCGSIWLVSATNYNQIETAYDADGNMGISAEGTSNSIYSMEGGSIGGLLTLKNETLATLQNDLDRLANAIIHEVNTCQVMGVGTAGSFSELTSTSLDSEYLADMDYVTEGELYIRVTNTATGEITRHVITIDAANDTVSDVATSISTITGLNASVSSTGQLTISSESDYEFDFLPCALPEPSTVDFDDASAPAVTVSGVYEGSENQTFLFTVKGNGAVGNGILELEVTDDSGEIIQTLNIGSGYAAGDWLDLGNGIKITVGIGNLAETDGDSFTVDALANSDTSGFLAAAGINALFSGNSAENMRVCEAISEEPGRIATSLSADITDNYNVTRMADIQDKVIDELDGFTCGEFYRVLVIDIGQQLSTKELYQENVEALLQNLIDQQSEISSVDINEESAKLLVFEQMYQAIAHYMTILNDSLESLMNLV